MDKANTILVVEDEKPLQLAIHRKLTNEGFDVVTARSVEQARGYLEDVAGIVGIWLDHYLLGTETGLDFVARLKQKGSKWNSLPIFVVSNTASPDKAQSYLRLGVNGYFTKSEFRLDDIILEIRQALKEGENIR